MPYGTRFIAGPLGLIIETIKMYLKLITFVLIGWSIISCAKDCEEPGDDMGQELMPECLFEYFGEPTTSYKLITPTSLFQTKLDFSGGIILINNKGQKLSNVDSGDSLMAQINLGVGEFPGGRNEPPIPHLLIARTEKFISSGNIDRDMEIGVQKLIDKTEWNSVDAQKGNLRFQIVGDTNLMNTNLVQEFRLSCTYYRSDSLYMGGEFHISRGIQEKHYHADGKFEGYGKTFK